VSKTKKFLPPLRETLVLTINSPLQFSYDLDMDTRLAEETTTLVESYTVSSPLSNLPSPTTTTLLSSVRSVNVIFCAFDMDKIAARRPNDQSWL